MGFVFLLPPALAGRFFTTSPPGEPMYTHIPPTFSLPPSHSPIPSLWSSQGTELSSLGFTANPCWLAVSHTVTYMIQRYPLNSSDRLLPVSASPSPMSAFLLLPCKLFFVLWYVVCIIYYPLNTNNSNSSLWVEAIWECEKRAPSRLGHEKRTLMITKTLLTDVCSAKFPTQNEVALCT